MRILITGASGFIGRNLLLRLTSKHSVIALYHKDKTFIRFLDEYGLNSVSSFCVDLANKKDLARLKVAIGNKIDACIYLAANGNPALSVKRPSWDLESNTISLINTCQTFNTKRFIFISSGAIYDGLNGKVSPKSKVSPRLPYAISKWASERYVEHFHEIGKIGKYVILRFFGAFGPFEPPRKIYSKLVRALCLEGKSEFTIVDDGNNLIDAMPVDDMILNLERVINSNRGNLIADFCLGSPLTVKGLVEEAGKIFNKKVRIKHMGTVPEYARFWGSSRVMEDEFGFESTLSLAYGLEKLANFLMEKK